MCSPCIWRTLVEVCSVSIRYGYLLWPVNVMRVGPRMLFRHTVLFMRVACHPRCWNLPLARLLGFVPFLVRFGFSLRPVIVVRVFFPPRSRGEGFRRGQACFALGLMIPCVGHACYIACCDDVRPWLLHWSIVVLGWLCVGFLSLLCTWPDDSVCWV